MNERIKQFAELSGFKVDWQHEDVQALKMARFEKFAELIVRECADICMEMAAKCAGLEGDGALAKDCAYWIKKDFGVEE